MKVINKFKNNTYLRLSYSNDMYIEYNIYNNETDLIREYKDNFEYIIIMKKYHNSITYNII